MMTLKLPESFARQIQREAEAAYPQECCGILYGRDVPGDDGVRRVVGRIEWVSNEFEESERRRRFLITPDVMMRAQTEADRRGEEILGFYHSHPDAPARPSAFDREHAWGFYSYVIVSVAKGEAVDVTSWVLDEATRRFERQDIDEVRDVEGIQGVEMSTGYARPEALTTTAWVAEHLDDPSVKLIEVDVDTTSYDKGHVPGAIGWNWQTDLQDRVVRDVIDPRSFAELCRRSGVNNDDTVIIYGDSNNWFAAWAFWQFKYHGHKDVRLMNGGRKLWMDVEKRETSTELPKISRSNYTIPATDESIRAYRDEIMATLGQGKINLVDVRSGDEFSGKVIAPPGMTETAQRGGHIPGAKNIPWAKASNEDGTFKSVEELKKLYGDAGVDFNKPTIAYCRIGERSSYTWFVLRYLLGVNNVKNYDGSWTEWGNLVGAPIEVGEGGGVLPNVRCQ